MTPSTLIAGAISGLLLGGLYAVTALGLSMVFGVMRLVNVAHGELLLLAAYLNFTLAGLLSIDPLLFVFLLIHVMFLVVYPLQRWIFNPLMHLGAEPPLLAAFGVSIILQNVMLLVWTADSRTLITSYSDAGVQLLGVRVSLLYLLALADVGSELGLSGSRDTILRLVRQSPPPARSEPHVIGLDDWAWKRRLRYGTLICEPSARFAH